MSFTFKPFQPINAFHDTYAIRAGLEDIGQSTQRAFIAGLNGPHSGRVYMRKGRSHQASSGGSGAGGEYPANDTGALKASTGHHTTNTEVVIGTNAPHSVFLAHGTTKMARRKFVDIAMHEAAGPALARMKPFARLRLGRWPT